MKEGCKFCECGCGEVVRLLNSRFKAGHNNKTKESKKRLSETNKGKKHTEETKRKISQANRGKNSASHKAKGKNHWNYKRKHSEESKKKVSLALKGEKSPWYRRKHTEETKRKISEFRKGRSFGPHSEETKRKIAMSTPRGKDHYMYGKRISRETKRKISLALSGPNNPSWRGGISCEPYCDVWADQEYKEDIKIRDNHQCQNPDCWHTTDHLPLHVHHIDYNKKNCCPDNLITLCCSCNTRANFNREHWKNLFMEVILCGFCALSHA